MGIKGESSGAMVSPAKSFRLHWGSRSRFDLVVSGLRRVLPWIVALVFIVAALPKLQDPRAFAEDVANFGVPYWAVNGIAALVPALELVAGLCVLTNFRRRAGLIVLASLTLAFLAAIYSVIVRGIDIQCGCFGQGEAASRVGWPLFWRDLFLLGAIALCLLPPRRTLGRTGHDWPGMSELTR